MVAVLQATAMPAQQPPQPAQVPPQTQGGARQPAEPVSVKAEVGAGASKSPPFALGHITAAVMNDLVAFRTLWQ